MTSALAFVFIIIFGTLGIIAGIAILFQSFVCWLTGKNYEESKQYQQEQETFKQYISWNSACNVLGINPREALESPHIIKNAYRKMAMKHHPDHGGDAEMFMMMKRAYDYLMS